MPADLDADFPALRPYQQEARAAVHARFDGGDRAVLVVMPTGSGKTIVFARVARDLCDRGQRGLVLAHRGELLDQARRHLERLNLRVAIEVADQHANPRGLFDDVVVASVQTMQGDRLGRWDPERFDFIVVDEAHHALAKSYRRILEHFARAKLLGVTATPERGDDGKLGLVFPVLAYEYSLTNAVEAGYLARIKIERPTTTVDLSKIRTTAGDLNRGDLEDAIAGHIEELVNDTRTRIGDRPTLVFTPDVGSAQAFASGLRQVGLTARSVSGKSADRHPTVKGFNDGDFQCLCNCVLITEGVDIPRIAAVVMARPTQSGVLYRQMAGRGTRLFDGKQDCVIIDWAWNSGRHKLVSPIELFDTTGKDPAVLEIAQDLMRTYPKIDPLKAIDQADRIHRHRAAVSVTIKETESRYQWVAFDPLAIGTLLGVPRRRPAANARPVAPGQHRRLERHKLGVEGLTERSAQRLLDHLEDRRRRGLATHRQVAALVSFGVPTEEATTCTFDAASARLGPFLGDRKVRTG